MVRDSSIQCTGRVDDAEHQLQVLSDQHSPASLQLFGHTTAAQRAAGERCLFPLALVDRHENAPAASADSAQGRNL